MADSKHVFVEVDAGRFLRCPARVTAPSDWDGEDHIPTRERERARIVALLRAEASKWQQASSSSFDYQASNAAAVIRELADELEASE